MKKDLIAKASDTINAPVKQVWNALVSPEAIKQYMFGTTVHTDWREGSPITWKGEWQGKSYEDRGKVLQIKPDHLLQYSHFSPLTGKPDQPQNYHTVTIELAEKDKQTLLSIAQDNNENEEAQQHSTENWQTMISGIKKLLEH